MKLNITRGLKARPQKVVIYAPEGIGKTTLAAACPVPLIIDLEQGSHHLDVARIEPQTYDDLLGILKELAQPESEFRTVVLDTVDKLEELMTGKVCRQANKSSIEEFGYGKGWVLVAEEFSRLLELLDKVAATHHLILLAHSEVRHQELPDHPGFDRYQLKLSKHNSPLLKGWADAVLFGSFKLAVREKDGKAKGVAARERVLRCCHSATADAKNRHGLDDLEPWTIDTLKKIFQSAPQPKAADPEQSADWMADLEKLLTPWEEPANKFLIGRNQVQASWRELSEDYARRILDKPEQFLTAINL